MIEVSDRLGGQRLVEILIQVAQEKGVPETIRADNGPEFTSKIFD